MKHLKEYVMQMVQFDNKTYGYEQRQELVRCKDCKWWDKKDGANYGYCHACKHGYYSDHWEIGIYRTYKGDFFCAEGEHKKGRRNGNEIWSQTAETDKLASAGRSRELTMGK